MLLRDINRTSSLFDKSKITASALNIQLQHLYLSVLLFCWIELIYIYSYAHRQRGGGGNDRELKVRKKRIFKIMSFIQHPAALMRLLETDIRPHIW